MSSDAENRELTNVDKFNPEIENEMSDYLLPEDQVDLESEIRLGTEDVTFEFKAGPPYLSSCYDEFSRRFITVNVAKTSSSSIPLVKVEDDKTEHLISILQSYHPGYSEWNSTFKRIPQDSRHLLSGKVFSDTNLVIKFKKCQINQKIFEPIFGSACIYSFLNDELLRITETFYFDATPELVRKQYSYAYGPELNDLEASFQGTSINVGDASGSQMHMNMFNATLPDELRDKDMFIVVQLAKILSTDSDKAVAPYYARAALPDLEKHKESCRRLYKYKQPLALGMVRINECLQGGKTEVKFPLYAQKLCVSEGFISQSIREIYPVEGTAPYSRMDLLDIEMNLILHDLGRHDMLNASLKEQGMSLSLKSVKSVDTSTVVGSSDHTVVGESLIPCIYPSQIQSESSPLKASSISKSVGAMKNSVKLVIRQVMPLLPASAGKETTRQFKATVDSTLYVYPIQLERFQNRNLCLKLELVELHATSTLTTKTILNAPYTALTSIYNHGSICGPLFVSEAYSRVSYHVKNPVLTDEIKIRLPDVLTGRHWLRFTVLHIHVKPTVGRASLLSSLIRSTVDKAEVESIELGIGMIPLMVNGGECLLEDKEYNIAMNLPSAELTSELPFIRFRTKAVSSLVSSDSRVQAALRHHPSPLGRFPTSIMDIATANLMITTHRPPAGSADRLVTATQELTRASSVELSRHFLVIIRQLLRTLIAGHGVPDETYSNPYKHTKARSQAFLTILQVIGKIASDGTSTAFSASTELSQEKEFLNAYVDFLFDEEVPIALPFNIFSTVPTEVNSINSSIFGGKMPNEIQSEIPVEGNMSVQSSISADCIEVVITNSCDNPQNHEDFGEIKSFENTSSILPTHPVLVENGSSESLNLNLYNSSSKILGNIQGINSSNIGGNENIGVATEESEEKISLKNPRIDIYCDPLLHMIEDSRTETTKLTDRRSWGNFITDAVWATGKLHPIGEVTLDICELGENYLEDIALHIVLQTERIVIERLIAVSSLAMVSQVHYNTDHRLEDRLHLVDEKLVMAGKRFRVPKAVVRSSLSIPFEDEKAWFDDVDAGESITKHDILISSAEQGTSDDFAFNNIPNYCQSKVLIQPILPRYDNIDGFRERTNKILDTSVLCQWWPWMYEVIVYQWGAVLAIILSASNLISSNNIESIIGSYPYEFDFFQKMEGQRDTRSLLMEHGPVLLKIMFKSLAMRISREFKRPPVVLDDQFLNALENLVMLLAVEAVSFKTGLWRSRRLVLSLSSFLRSLFALVAPNQVIRLIRTYFRAVRKGKADVEAAELRLQMIEEISLFDHIVAVNFPYTLDATMSMFTFNSSESGPPINLQSNAAFTSAGFRSNHYLPPYALSHMIISEVMSLYRQEERKIKNAALEILRDLLVRHTYDLRYHSKESQQRIVCMYLPLMKDILDEGSNLAISRHDSVDRKEILAMLLYILENIPLNLLRHHIRSMCDIRFATEGVKNISSLNEYQSGSTCSPRIISVRQQTPASHFSSFSTEFVQKNQFHSLPICKLILILHQVLDTFELPVASDEQVAFKPDASVCGQVLSPTVSLNADDVSMENIVSGSIVNGGSQANMNNRRLTTDGTSGQSTRMGMATSLLANLDQRMQTRKVNTTTRKSVTSGNSGGIMKTGGDDRKWIEHARKMAGVDANSVKDRSVVFQNMSRVSLLCASIQVSCSSVDIVLKVLTALFEECPVCLLTSDSSVSRKSGTTVNDEENIFLFRESNIDESMLIGIKDLRIVEFMKMSLGVLLHSFFCQHNHDSVKALFDASNRVVRQFGAKIFFVSVEDSLQDWMRVGYFYCSSVSPQVREAASNFLLLLLRACYHYSGSCTLIVNTSLAVIGDVLTEILENQKSSILVHSDEDRVLHGLNDSISVMKMASEMKFLEVCSDTVSSKYSFPPTPVAFYHAVSRLMTDLQVILLASAELRRYVTHPVAYDFLGANMLDGPFDDRTTALTHLMRQQRKAVKADGSVYQQGTTNSGFQIEEVMIHFVHAAEVYDPIKLPRFRIQWLENLVRLHELRLNRAEGAEIRWRIFQICQAVEDTWQVQWVPRPPLDWSRRGLINVDFNGTNNNTELSSNQSPLNKSHDIPDRNFYQTFLRAMDARPFRAWCSCQQYLAHMESALAVATERFCATNLIHLAERTSSHLIQLYRISKQVELMSGEYGRILGAFKTMSDKGITSAMAVGTFYRVFYDGRGSPDYLRGKEFIFRNANHLHVSEFQTLVISHLKSIVLPGVDVKIVQDINSAQKNLDDINIAFMVMNSVKLVVSKSSKLSFRAINNNVVKRPMFFAGDFGGNEGNKHIEALNQVSVFQYSVPFTKDATRAHAKRIDEQWLRTTVLTVKEPFPYILTRQLVVRRDIRDFCPIEVAINDIEERIDAMEVELEKSTGKNSSDNNNLMRIVQGTVMPQVNGGAAEVAKVFLSPHKLMSDSLQLQILREAVVLDGSISLINDSVENENKEDNVKFSALDLSYEELKMRQHTLKLKITLADFLTCSKLLLAKTRRVLISDSFVDQSMASAAAEVSLVQPVQSNVLNGKNTTVVGKRAGETVNGTILTASSSNINPVTNTVGSTLFNPIELNYIIWQTEMEKGFDNLVQSILPFIKDLGEDAEHFQLSTK